MKWHLLQALVAFCVLSANEYYGVTEYRGVVAGWAVMAAIAVTWLIQQGIDARRFGLSTVIRGWKRKRP